MLRRILSPWTRNWFLVLALVFSAGNGHAQILHLELGAANAADASTSPNDASRFAVLDITVENLVAKFGPAGTIYLNDIDLIGLGEAAKHVRSYLANHGYGGIQVETIAGNFLVTDLPFVKTMNLSNPGKDLLPSALKGRAYNEVLVSRYENLAALSLTGIRIATYFDRAGVDFALAIPMFLSSESKMSRSTEKNPPYLYPDGTTEVTKWGALEVPEVHTYYLRTTRDYHDPETGQLRLSPWRIHQDLSSHPLAAGRCALISAAARAAQARH